MAPKDNSKKSAKDLKKSILKNRPDKNKKKTLISHVKKSKPKKVKVPKKRQLTDYSTRGIVFISHIPKGFFEEQIKGYFSQFGCVIRVRLARSEKTGKSRGFAFVEFRDKEVAKIAAETMNNYLMQTRLVKAKLVKPSKSVREILNKLQITEKNYPKLKNRKLTNEIKNIERDEANVKQVLNRRVKKLKKNLKKLKENGIEYSLKVYK